MISVIVAVYNVEKYIVNCLKSIVNQDYADFELILVDDGSSDNSCNVINDYLKDSNINWQLIKKENGGQSSSRNLGVSKAKGEYISFIDSDDVVTSDFLSSLKKLIDDNDADFSFCNYEYVKQQLPPEDTNNEICVYNRDELLNIFLRRTINFVLPSMMLKKDFLLKNNIVFDENIRFSEDQMYIWDVIFNSNKSVYTNRKMYGYYLREKSIMTGSPYKKIMNGYEVYGKFVDELKDKYPQNKDIIKLILPRWELGTLYSAAKIIDYEEFESMYKKMNGSSLHSRLKGINETKANGLSLIAKSPKLLYFICRNLI